MNVLATIRPDSWNFPLFLHVLGAMILVGAAVTAVAAELVPTSNDTGRMRRFAFRTLLFVGVPAYLVMRVGAEWMYSKEFGDAKSDPTWIGIGYATADGGALLLVLAVILAGIASRRSSAGLGKAAGVIAAIALVGWIVTVWAMGAKPS